jgi:putative SbcD/Mre11-related phosphoesterase
MPKLGILYPHPALKLTEAGEDYLVVSDLHIGFEQRFNREGFNITPSTGKMLKTLTELIQQHKPDRLLILGDVKSGFSRVSRDEWKHVPKFMEKIANLVEVSVIPGNHDGGLTPLLPREVKLEPKEVQVHDTVFLHGHTNPTRKLIGAKRLVMGHIHPSYSRKGSPLSGRPVWLTLRVVKKIVFADFEGDDLLEVWVMPSFNTELSATGLTVHRERIISPLLRKIDGAVAEALIITLDGSVIGDADSINYVL